MPDFNHLVSDIRAHHFGLYLALRRNGSITEEEYLDAVETARLKVDTVVGYSRNQYEFPEDKILDTVEHTS